MDVKCGVYSITNWVNGKRNIGQAQDVIKRWGQHKSALRHNRHVNSYLQNAWNKYGEQNFNFEILMLCSLEKLDKEEKRLIDKYKTINREFGYNLKDGGNRPKFSKESREKMSKSRIGKYSGENHYNYGKHRSEETKKKISDGHLGLKHSEEAKQKIGNYWRGRKKGPMKEETKLMLSKKSKGRPPHKNALSNLLNMAKKRIGTHLSEETRVKISKAHMGMKNSEETRRKLSMALSGKNHPLFGTIRSEETRRKIGLKRKGQKHTDEAKKKISEATKKRFEGTHGTFFGKKHSEESRRKISASRKGKCVGADNPFYGQKRSEEPRRKMSESQKRRFAKKN